MPVVERDELPSGGASLFLPNVKGAYLPHLVSVCTCLELGEVTVIHQRDAVKKKENDPKLSWESHFGREMVMYKRLW